MDDVWTLETPAEDIAGEELGIIAQWATSNSTHYRNYLKSLWPECSWETIKERLNAEGATWYVWWMDGVRQHLANCLYQ